MVQKMFASMSVQKSCYFILFSLLDVIYNEILQVWYFKVSTTACFLYLQTLRKQKKTNKTNKKKNNKNKMI